MANNFYFSAFDSPDFHVWTFDATTGEHYAHMEEFWLNFVLYTQIVNGLVLLVSIIQISYIVKKHGYNKMLDRTAIAIHGFFFAFYVASVLFFAVWNTASNQALNHTIDLHFITHIKTEYTNWMKSYY